MMHRKSDVDKIINKLIFQECEKTKNKSIEINKVMTFRSLLKE